MSIEIKSRSKLHLNLLFSLVSVSALIVVGWLAWQHYHKDLRTIPSSQPKQEKQLSKEGSSEKHGAVPGSQNSVASLKANVATSESSSSTAILLTPSGNFVSNHHPSLSSNNAPSDEQSVCNTTPGAICKIHFSKGSEVKTLQAQLADVDGNAYWNWNVKSAGFSIGSWRVTAYASLGGKTLSASDALDLEVGP